MKSCTLLLVFLGGAIAFPAAQAGVSAEESAKLGQSLTVFGAEKAGNADGSIPAYTGGLPVSTNPPGFKKDSGKWVNPFAEEKPLYSITGKNAAQYADKLSEASKALLERYPSYRMDVYPTHRTARYPQYILDKTLKNATQASLAKEGMAVQGAIGGIPFPIPKSGYEVMWNHMARYSGVAAEYHMRNFYVDNTGKLINSGEIRLSSGFPFHNPEATADSVKKDDAYIFRQAYNFTGPARSVGDATTYFDTIDMEAMPRRAYTYSASTRRVRLGPDIAYDTPVASQGGVTTYDDANLYSNKMDRFDFKLVGKREMLIPYSIYDLSFQVKSDKTLTPNHINPDFVRWELHRVWVVEATLKPGFRHLYSKRRFYLDEDWSGAGMSDEYDGAGKLYKGLFQGMTQLYDREIPLAQTYWAYDLSSGVYSCSQQMADLELGWRVVDKPQPNRVFTPEALQNRSGR
ncbi:DUF1329 domain-containing protein [Pseudomonas sp. NFACC07-1]|uniref:DUF1329 domain-containing protein n=1 Tax=Pseudomonas sp. NFACC07-1 TaxID=1566239 RepID=UPI0008B847C6|nr:DUF1329 domain-containing protein [Pseudomonas sp. NFACC07-1]SEI51502.1 Protein of unknown function [Pseudomonas sp. NFACC07-1]